MESNKRKKIKKIFAYFFGFYFLVFGALMSCGEVMAAGIGESCVTAAECGTAGFGENGAKLKCDFQPPFVGKVCMVDLSVGNTTLPKEEYTPVKQVISADPLKFTPQIKIPGTAIDGTVEVGKQVGTKMTSTLLPSYIGAFYKYGLTVTGLLATVILMAGGIIWLTSAGNESKVKQAKEMIFGSLAGVLLLFSSYIILETINPELVKLKPIESQSIAKVTLDIVCCQTTTGASMMDATECHDSGGSRMQGYMAIGGTCVQEGCCMRVRTRTDEKGENKKNIILSCNDAAYTMCNRDLKNQWSNGDKLGENDYFDPAKDRVSDENLFINTSCSKDNRCLSIKTSDTGDNSFNDCENKKDGKSCKIINESGYCYNNKCYIGDGQDGEPCGNDNGICRNKETYGGCVDDDAGGRDCVSGVWCCVNGTTRGKDK